MFKFQSDKGFILICSSNNELSNFDRRNKKMREEKGEREREIEKEVQNRVNEKRVKHLNQRLREK